MSEVNIVQAQKIVNSIDIPPQPATLTEVMRLLNDDGADLSQAADIISKDVSLSASVIKTINSPFFGMRSEITSIQQATMLLGMANVVNIVTGLSLRASMEGDGPNLGRFWDTATDTALICAKVANQLRSKTKEHAYMFGLFHDCGIPLMQKKYDDYFEVLKDANADSEGIFTANEDDHYDSNHTVVDYIVSRTWKLPRNICQAILEHHNPEILEEDSEISELIAILMMAEHLSHTARRLAEDLRWERMREGVLDRLMLSEEDYIELKADIHDMLDS